MGGKHYLAKHIIGLMPKHIHYVEPYFGGGSVLLQKPYEGYSEVVNDIYGDLINFWKVLKNSSDFLVFQQQVEVSCFSEEEFRQAQDILNKPIQPTDDLIIRAVAFFIVARQSRQGLMKDFATLSKNRTRRGMNEQVSSWLSAIEGLPEVHNRLKRVVILNKPALEVIKSEDSSNTLFYLDPPYVKSTRTAKDCYEFEMTDDEHIELLNTICKINGKFILSGYHNQPYDDFARLNNWNCKEFAIDNKSSSSKIKEIKTECLWMNY